MARRRDRLATERGLRSDDVDAEHPFSCELCGSVGIPLPPPPAVSATGNLVIGLDPECAGCQSLAQDFGVVFPPHFGIAPFTEW